MWLAIAVGEDEIHIIPTQDLIEHEHNAQCVCQPTTTPLEGDWKMLVHSSLDGREYDEPDWEGLKHSA